MDIRFVDIQRQYKVLEEEVTLAIKKVLDTGDFILGSEVTRFEKSFADYIGTRYAVTVDSGTSALELCVKALGIGAGDEVITAPNSYISTAFAVSESGANVVFSDVEESTQLMDVALMCKAITKNTKAIIPVHLFGQMANMEEVLKVARENKLFVIEDACQAHGSMQNGKKAGAYGDLGCFSFYPGKNLGAYGDGGAITTNNEELYDKLLLLRNFGSAKKYIHNFKGVNARLDTIQAAVLNVKLKYLDGWNSRRKEICDFYLKELNGTGDIILLHHEAHNASCNHLFVIRTQKRDALFDFLNANNIQTVIHYPLPIHLQAAYQELNLPKGSFPITEKLANQIVSLPIHPDLTNEEAAFVVAKIKSFYH